MILSLASAITRVPTMALFVFVMQSAGVEVACILTDSEQVAGSLTLVDSKLAGCVLDALPVLQEPAGSSWRGVCQSVPPPSPPHPLTANSIKEHE